eukprot:1840950-Prymnesium_polylepis.1
MPKATSTDVTWRIVEKRLYGARRAADERGAARRRRRRAVVRAVAAGRQLTPMAKAGNRWRVTRASGLRCCRGGPGSMGGCG